MSLKRILALLFLSSPLLAQTTGAPLNLALPNVHSPNWNIPLNNNFTTINSSYALTALKNNPVFTGIVTFPITGSTQCLHVNNVGVVSGVGFDCGGGGGGAVSSVFGRTGAVVANTGDYSFSQIGGTAAVSQLPLATTSTVGAVRPDNSTITISSGVLSAVSASTGFPITIGTTSIPANSTTTSLSGLVVNGVTLTAAGSASNFLNQAGAYVSLPSPPVTSVGGTAPIVSSGGSAPNLSCATCVTSVNPGAGIAHFGGATQAVTSSAVNLASSDVTATLTIAHGGTGTTTPALTAGSGISITGSWPNNTITNTGAGAVTSVSNSDGTLTISPTTGAVVASLALGHANTWTAPITVAVAGGQGGTFDATEGTTATLASGHDVLYGDSTAHCMEYSANGGGVTCLASGTGTAPVENFGAVGYTTLSAAISGTDSTTAIQNCLNSFNGIGGQCLLQAKYYRVTAALSITHSGVGIRGVVPLVSNGGIIPAPTASAIVSTSASADIIDVAGVDGTHQLGNNRFEFFSLMRSLSPTGTAAGFSMNNTAGIYLNSVVSEDSVRGFYIHDSGSIGIGDIFNCAAQWGYNGFVESSGNFYGFYADSGDGVGNASLRLRNDFVASNLGGTPVTYGYYDTGTQMADLMSWNFETAGLTYGIYINYTGSGSFPSEDDIHFYAPILDNTTTSAIFVTGLTSAGFASLQVVGGWANSVSGSAIDIESSSGVSISNMQVLGGTPTIYVNGSTNISITGNTLSESNSTGIRLNNSSNSIVMGNKIIGSTGGAQISLTTASSNVVSSNSISGTSANGISVDSNSNNNTGLETNSVGSGSTTPFSVLGSNPTATIPLSASQINVLPTSGTNSGNINFGLSFGFDAIDLFSNGANKYGFGLNGGELQTFVQDASATHWSWNAANGGLQPSGTAEFMRFTPRTTSATLNLTNLGVYAFSSTSSSSGSPDTGISRGSAGIVAVGNGTPGDISGGLQANFVQIGVTVFSSLGTATTANKGTMVIITDSSTSGDAVCAGGGSTTVLAISNGSTWTCR